MTNTYVRDDNSCKCNKINNKRRNVCTHFQQFVESLEPMLICYILEGRLSGKEDDIKLRLFTDRNNMNINILVLLGDLICKVVLKTIFWDGNAKVHQS